MEEDDIIEIETQERGHVDRTQLMVTHKREATVRQILLKSSDAAYFQSVLTEWAGRRVKPNERVTVYEVHQVLTGHGGVVFLADDRY